MWSAPSSSAPIRRRRLSLCQLGEQQRFVMAAHSPRPSDVVRCQPYPSAPRDGALQLRGVGSASGGRVCGRSLAQRVTVDSAKIGRAAPGPAGETALLQFAQTPPLMAIVHQDPRDEDRDDQCHQKIGRHDEGPVWTERHGAFRWLNRRFWSDQEWIPALDIGSSHRTKKRPSPLPTLCLVSSQSGHQRTQQEPAPLSSYMTGSEISNIGLADWRPGACRDAIVWAMRSGQATRAARRRSIIARLAIRFEVNRR